MASDPANSNDDGSKNISQDQKDDPNPTKREFTTSDSKEDEYEITVQPNKLVYFDASGVEHEIYLPRGTSERAGQLWLKEDWDQLAKYPKWENQQYAEEDYIRKKRDT
ncbi:hypothetical protein S7711_11401 [Stachybotrys chartarum IBT 7711]|uniref:Uncharacterized protein n=1 Tax=Stachybotrys chartarum (strain CBS 109288 / IBT 7711) TaxID=1280523 RepID=A0A084B8S2_STACB|nr:hypothetical protein S7711_11401 [Stachybotrys chartarum IBT 7711]